MNVTYELRDGTAVITKYTGQDRDVTVPAAIEGCPVTAIGPQAFFEKKVVFGHPADNALTLDSLTLPDTVVSIGEEAFRGLCLRCLHLPAGLMEVGKDAFQGVTGLETLYLPGNLNSAGAFYALRDLRAFTADPDSRVFSARDGLLYNRDGTELLRCPMAWQGDTCVLPDGVERISKGAFQDCKGIARVILPQSVRTIDEGAFAGCSALTEIELPDSVETLGKSAFSHCGSLRSVTLPAHLNDIADYAFYHCTALRTIRLPAGIRRIGRDAFTLCRSLEFLVLPDGLGEIGERAFLYCSRLRAVTVPEGIVSVPAEAFSSCTGLRSVTLPETLKTIGDRAFHGCAGLETINIPAGVERIGAGAFGGCGLKALGVPEGVGQFEEWFDPAEPIIPCLYGIDIDRLRSPLWRERAARGYLEIGLAGGTLRPELARGYRRYIRDHCAAFYDEALKNEAMLHYLMEDRMIPLRDLDGLLARTEGRTDLRAALLEYRNHNFSAADFEEMELEELERMLRGPTAAELQLIWKTARRPDGSFSLVSYLGTEKEILVPARIGKVPVTEIAYDCFSPWRVGLNDDERRIRESIVSVTLPDTVTDIAAGAFRGCRDLTAVRLPPGLKRLGSAAFSDCTALKDIRIPAGLEEIGKAVFLGCPALADDDGFVIAAGQLYDYCGKGKQARIPDGVTAVSARAFEGAGTLTEVTIPDTVTVIGEYAFSLCSRLKTLRVPGSVREIHRAAFFGCTDLERVYLEDGVRVLGDLAFRDCRSLRAIRMPATLRDIGVNALQDCDDPILSGPENPTARAYARLYYLRYECEQEEPHT